MEAVGAFFSLIIFIILLIALLKFFSLCGDIQKIKWMLTDFVKYYGEVQKWKQNQVKV